MSGAKADSAERFPRRTQRRQNTRARILDAARALFRRVGYGAATMNAIAEAADIHVTTLFTHFKSKQDLAASLNDAEIERLRVLIADARGRVPFFRFYRDVALGTARTLGGEAEPSMTLWHVLKHDGELALVWADYQQRLLSLLAAYIAADHGRAEDDYAVLLAAGVVVSSGTLSHRRWSGDTEGVDLEKETIAALDIAETMARAALAAPPSYRSGGYS